MYSSPFGRAGKKWKGVGDLTAPERRSPAAPPEYLEGSGAGQSGFRSKKVRAKDIISPPKEVFFCQEDRIC
ncbi:hypothetical protein A2780_00150 [Candidatus Daviesbacteria bacterium RIFCSPHIGHO2_01_FULL_41_45]|nr:MAG: hypothetical protein A2780_00150 [Candidatus Daviesbacteria bacterium RIFCSPHIGHO2_01_FULL_41_45]